MTVYVFRIVNTERTDSLLVCHLKILQMSIFTGYNSKMSGIINFRVKGAEGALLDPNEQITEGFCHLISETVLELRVSGSIVYFQGN